MTKTALIVLALALAVPAVASAQNTNTNTNTITIGKPVAPVVVKPQPPKQVQPPKPVTSTPKPAIPRKTPMATSSAQGGASNVGVNADSNSNSTATGGAGGTATAAGGAGGTASASAGSVSFTNSNSRSAPSPTAPAMFSGADCSTATSGSVTTGVLGLALGITGADQGCEARQNFALLAANGLDRAAAAAFCYGTETQQNIIAAQGIDCAALTNGKVKPLTISGLDMKAFCSEPIGDHQQWADRRRVCVASGH